MTDDMTNAHKARATGDQFAESLRPIIEAAREQGVTSYHAMADYLKAQGVKTSNGHGVWDHEAAGCL
jgi:hypothetical protein